MKPYEKHYSFSQASSSTGEVFEMEFPEYSIIKKFVVQQTGGTDISYTATIYNADPSSLSADAKVVHTVIPEQSAMAGDAVAIFQGDYLALNTEGTATVPVRKLYLELTATASDACTCEVALGSLITTAT